MDTYRILLVFNMINIAIQDNLGRTQINEGKLIRRACESGKQYDITPEEIQEVLKKTVREIAMLV